MSKIIETDLYIINYSDSLQALANKTIDIINKMFDYYDKELYYKGGEG